MLFGWNSTAKPASSINNNHHHKKGNKKQFATLRRFAVPLRIELLPTTIAVLGIHGIVMNNFQSKLFANPSLVLVCVSASLRLFRVSFLCYRIFRYFAWLWLSKSQILAEGEKKTAKNTAWTIDIRDDLSIGLIENCDCELQLEVVACQTATLFST